MTPDRCGTITPAACFMPSTTLRSVTAIVRPKASSRSLPLEPTAPMMPAMQNRTPGPLAGHEDAGRLRPPRQAGAVASGLDGDEAGVGGEAGRVVRDECGHGDDVVSGPIEGAGVEDPDLVPPAELTGAGRELAVRFE